MAVQYSDGKQTASAATRLVTAAVAGIVALIITGSSLAWYLAPLIGWDIAALVYLVWIWFTLNKLTASETSDFALREDPSRIVADGVLMVASVASLVALAVVLVGASGSHTAKLLQIGLGVASVVLSWVLTHTVFMLRYAEAYYRGEAGGVEFEGAHWPTFTDFAYLAFTLGMTFQVSDTGFKSTSFRALALKHALLSYLFGTVIVATTINLVAGLIQ